MPKTFVVGDSIATGIGGAIRPALPAEQILAANGRPIAGMTDFFRRAIAAAESGDTVIVAAGYNSTIATGLAPADVRQLQGWIQQLRADNVNVVIAGLRETNIVGDYSRLNGQTAHTNRQLREIARATGATFSEESLRIANSIPTSRNQNIHGNYTELANALAPAGRSRAPGRSDDSAGDSDASGSSQQQGWWEWLIAIPIIGPVIEWIYNLVAGMFGGGSQTSSPPATTPSSANTAAAAEPSPAQAPEQTLAVPIQAPTVPVQGQPLTSEYLDSLLEPPPTPPAVTPTASPVSMPPQAQEQALAITQGGRPLNLQDIETNLPTPPLPIGTSRSSGSINGPK